MEQRDFLKDPIEEGSLVETGKQEVAPINIGNDTLMMVAREAEERINAVKKIKSISLQVTNPNDWIDEGGKPYLQVSGSEKVARVFGISWRISEPVFDIGQDGHYMYRYKGEFTLKGASIEAVGTRSSRDAFFSRRGEWKDGKKTVVDIPPENIDKANVMKGAYTNCIGNGITRLLGIRNLTWKELEEVGIKPATKVNFKSSGGKGKISDKQKEMMEKLMKKLKTDEATYLSGKKMDDLTISEASDMINDLLSQVKEGNGGDK